MPTQPSSKIPILTTLPDGSIDPNCYACRVGYVMLTSTGKISLESPAVKKKQLLIKKNGQVDNRSAICKVSVDQFQANQEGKSSLQTATPEGQGVVSTAYDSTDSSTSMMHQGPSLPSFQEYKPIVAPPAVQVQPTVQQALPPGEPVVPPPLPPAQYQPILPSPTLPAPPPTKHMGPLPPPQIPQRPPPQRPEIWGSDRHTEHRAPSNGSAYTPKLLFQRAAIQRTYEFAPSPHFLDLGKSYFTYAFISFLQRFFHRPVDSEEEALFGLQHLYVNLNRDMREVFNRNLPGCEKEIVSRLLDRSIQLLSPSVISVVDVIERTVPNMRLSTNACQTLYHLSRYIKGMLG